MTGRTRQGLTIGGAGLAFGLVADVLGRSVPGRLDVALGVGALVLAAGYVLVREPDLQGPHPGFGLAAGILALALVWRDSATLFALNLLAIVGLAAVALPRVRRLGLGAGVMDYAAGTLRLASAAAAGTPLLVFREIDWRSLPDDAPMRRLRGPAVGLLAALPIAVVFGGLLSDADPVFERILSDTLAIRLEAVAPHAVAVLGWGWLATGLIAALLWPSPGGRRAELPRGRFGLAEVGTVLVVVDLLFLAFVAVQFRTLFGGAAFVQAVSGLSYAEYARGGFFQLVTVAALSLPLLLAADWLLAERDRAGLRRFRALALLMLLLLDVMLASALHRMRLYTAEFGLTELRFYTIAFMGWLVLVLGWFAATVLRARRQRFAPGALGAGVLVLGALNLLNPDGVIAGTNLARAAQGRAVDARYAASLSADALPTIRRLLPGLPAAARCALSHEVRERWSDELREARRWNIAVGRAARAMTDGWDLVPRGPAGGCLGIGGG
jgi:hypothetical protein